jgi:hypothetical protein
MEAQAGVTETAAAFFIGCEEPFLRKKKGDRGVKQ